ncbi:sigma-70 family RNA polymerase sigma factor (plasmid) [Streptomyces sp. BI20]|uniref:sigma-70 family RNA polymerase sigma factor n=1 Tax=Streptomyces sp. BI20 TaxID=3403460 RepID=UPI003C78A719
MTHPPEPPTPDAVDRAGRVFAALNDAIRAGEEARAARAELIRGLADAGWTQEQIARLAELSQPAVSKQLLRPRPPGAAPAPAPGAPLRLDHRDPAWLEGRLWAVAEDLVRLFGADAACAPRVHALARGRERLTPRSADALRRLVEEDLRRPAPAGRPTTAHRAAYDEIARALDTATGRAAPAADGPGADGTASARRALARRAQLDALDTP